MQDLAPQQRQAPAGMRYENTECNILLIEDSQTDIDLIQRAIQKTDSKVHLEVARSGEEALETLKRWEAGAPTPIVILLDVKLPGVGGLEVLQALKTHPRYRILPVIVLTASTEAAHIQQAYKAGANSYIIKAVDYDEFVGAIALIHHYWCELNIHPD